MLEYENMLAARGYEAVCGVDEAGCGPLAGPVYAAAVILRADDGIEGLDDSKKLSEKKREALFDLICARAAAWSVAEASAEQIDRDNILEARLAAMRAAVDGLSVRPDWALVDGDRDPGLSVETLLIVKGDQKSASIAAASIVAKVLRDRHMRTLDARYPGYGFSAHKGYPTTAHYAALDRLGPCPEHRRSFLVKYFARRAGARV